MWPSRTFWPLICEDGKHINNMYKQVLFPFRPKFINHSDITSTLFKGDCAFDWIILYFDTKCSDPLKSKISPDRCVDGGCVMCKWYSK